jgi:hypothetical protein
MFYDSDEVHPLTADVCPHFVSAQPPVSGFVMGVVVSPLEYGGFHIVADVQLLLWDSFYLLSQLARGKLFVCKISVIPCCFDSPFSDFFYP